MGHFRGVGKGQRAKFRHKLSVLTPVSRTISSEWTGKGRPGLPWLAATGGLCPSADGWVPEAPRYPVPPPHSPLSTAMALSYRLPSLPRFCVASRAVLAGPAVQQRLLQSCLWLPRLARRGLAPAGGEALAQASSAVSRCRERRPQRGRWQLAPGGSPQQGQEMRRAALVPSGTFQRRQPTRKGSLK